MKTAPFGWCFIGAGSIAERVYADFPSMENAFVASVYARTDRRAAAFAKRTGATYYPSLDEAVQDASVQAVYIAVPHSEHLACTLAALRHGKPVLCEKPFALTGQDAQEMIRFARQQKLLLMEGMWTRFHPAIGQVLQWVREGRIGTVTGMEARFTSDFDLTTPSRLTELEQGGGGLMDIGVYTVALARIIFGRQPERIQALADFAPSGVDRQCAMLLQYEHGAIARLYASLVPPATHDAVIYGTEGSISIPRFYAPDCATLHLRDGDRAFEAKRKGEGFFYQFNAFMQDVRAGRLEDELVSHQFTLDVMETLDAIRDRIGLRFDVTSG